MKKHLSTIIMVFFLFLGLGIMLYPAVSNYINTKNASKVVAVYNDALEKASAEQIAAVFAQADEYNRALAANPSAFYSPYLIPGYTETLDITGTGVMGYISIDKINVKLPIYHGTEDVVLQIGVGHLEGTSLPSGGAGTHCVLSGHRGLPSAKLFSDLDKLEPGDTFSITIMNHTLNYEVDQILVVTPQETTALQIEQDKDYCTLLTCTPYGINTHRLLVRGVRLEDEVQHPGIYVLNEAFQMDMLVVAPIYSVPLLVLVLPFMFRKKKH